MERLPALMELRRLLRGDCLGEVLEERAVPLLAQQGDGLFADPVVEPNWLRDWIDAEVGRLAVVLVARPDFPGGWPESVELLGSELLARRLHRYSGELVGGWLNRHLAHVSLEERCTRGLDQLHRWLEANDAPLDEAAQRVLTAYIGRPREQLRSRRPTT